MTTTSATVLGIGAAMTLLLAGGCSPASSAGPLTPATPQLTAAATAVAIPTIAPTAEPSPVGAAGEFAWQQIASFEASPTLIGIAASPAGYAVLVWDGVWHSSDGRTWAKSALPFRETTSNGVELRAHANAIAGGPGGFVVVGGQSVLPCDNVDEGAGGLPPCLVAPISWTSPDGITWTSSLPTPIPASGARLRDYTELVSIWPADGGWDAAGESRASVVSAGNALLHSKDGLVWSSLKAAPLPGGVSSAREVNGHGGVASGTGTRLVWQYTETTAGVSTPQTTLWSTADGLIWAAVASFEDTNTAVRFALAPEATGAGPWLLIGNSYALGAVTWWTSNDLTEWQSGPMITTGAPMQSIFALGRWADGYIVLGSQDGDSYPGRPGTFLSDDGMTWRAAGFVDQAPLNGPIVMADGPAGLIGVGSDEAGSIVWLGVDPRR